jgi:hypothetical protein
MPAMSDIQQQMRESGLQNVLTELMEAVILQKPTDVMAFAAEFMAQKGGSPHNQQSPVKAPIPASSSIFNEILPSNMIEADTKTGEEIQSLDELLLPNQMLPRAGTRRFSLSYSMAALDGWVKQNSPVCAAASIAGAWNTVHALKHGEEGAETTEGALEQMRALLRQKIAKCRGSAERLMNCSIQPCLDVIDAYAEAQGISIGGNGIKDHPQSKGLSVTFMWKKIVEAALEVQADGSFCREEPVWEHLRQMWKRENEAAQAEETLESASTLPPEAEQVNEALDQLMDFSAMFAAGPKPKGKVKGKGKAKGKGPVPKPPAADAADNDGVEEGESELDVEEEGGGASAATMNGQTHDYGRSQIGEVLRLTVGLSKLCRERPHTSIFGNWGILQGMQAISDVHVEGAARATLFMGRKIKGSSVEWAVTAADSAERKEELWDALQRVLKRDECAIIFHLTNHYALVFALRETVTAEGKYVREMLTARRGQRPTVWMDWEEAHQLMVRVAGYKLMKITRLQAITPAAPAVSSDMETVGSSPETQH